METEPAVSRSRRKVTRVNYAEDNSSLDDLSLASAPASSSKQPKSSAKKTALNNSGSIDSNNGNGNKSEPNSNSSFPMNWQRRIAANEKLSTVIDYTDAKLEADGKIHLQDGMTLGLEDHIYILSEPPGEPYYIGRIMEFVTKPEKPHKNESNNGKASSPTQSPKQSTIAPKKRDEILDKYSMRVNWLYRPKDISKKSNDSRLLYATMNSDICPLQSVRGKCTVKHKDHIDDVQQYRCRADSFWFDKLYDRHIVRFFDVIPTEKIINVPKKIQGILCARYKYIIVEIGKGKEFCSVPNNCEKCSQWCSPEDSVQCAHCGNYYHMLCVDPPLYRKPSRGFAWSCAPCSGALEQKLKENRGIDDSQGSNDITEKQEKKEDEDEEDDEEGEITDVAVAEITREGSRSSPSSPSPMSRYEEVNAAFASMDRKIKSSSDNDNDEGMTEDQVHQLSLWPFRYLGMHAKIEDVLDLDDRIYPRAASRISSRHQANVPDWPGRPVIYVEVEKQKNKKNYKNSRRSDKKENDEAEKKESNQSEELLPSAIPKKDRPAWIQDKPPGYIERGDDTTVSLNWKNPEDLSAIEEFVKKTEPYAIKLKMSPNSPNFVDACLKAYMDSNYNATAALSVVSTFTRKTLKEPTFTADEKSRFEEAVRKYGNELHEVFKEVKNKKSSDIVRYYYLWKKTESGHQIWDNYEDRKRRKNLDIHLVNGLVDEVADTDDDSAYDNEKSRILKRMYCCKFCETTTSREWRRAPGAPVAGPENPIIALCIRCARLWRKYAVVWEDPEEVLKKANQRGGNGWKRKVEEELLEDSKAIIAERDKDRERDKSRKKMKVEKLQKDKVLSKESSAEAMLVDSEDKYESGPLKYEDAELQATGESKRPCAVCGLIEPAGQQLNCQSCGLITHSRCYGVYDKKEAEGANSGWLCDPCSNDQKPCISTLYSCAVCPVRDSAYELEAAGEITVLPDALKRTYDNNWAHVRCAVWMPDLKFGNAKYLQPIENIPLVDGARFKDECSICNTSNGACTSCNVCNAKFHIGCAGKHGYAFGFEIQLVKSSRRDLTTTVRLNGDAGQLMIASVLCPSHIQQISKLHSMTEIDSESGRTLLEIFCQNYKQADPKVYGALKSAMMYPLDKVRLKEPEPEFKSVAADIDSAPLILPTTDLSNLEIEGHVSCSGCSITDAFYWMKNSSEKLVCPECYWKEQEPDLYNEVYSPKEEISILNQESITKMMNYGLTALKVISSSNSFGQVQQQTPRERTMLTNLLNPLPEPTTVIQTEASSSSNSSATLNGDTEVKKVPLHDILIN